MNFGPNFRKLPFLVLAALVIAGLGALVGRYVVLREVPTKKETFKALSWLQDDFGSLYRVLTPGARALVEDPDDKNQILEDPDAPLTRSDLRRKTAAIRQEALSWIRKGLRTRYESAVASANQRLVRYVFSAPGEPVDWASGVGEVCRSLTLENLGPVVAENVVIVLDGERLAATLREMTASLLGSAATEKDKALALWRGVVEGRRHDWPAHAEASDPIKLLGVYGYGFCLDSAQALALLAESAGLSARVMHARGAHVVTEILIDGRWALFDADAAVFYRKPDGNVASIADVQQDLELLADSESNIYSKEHLRRIYASSDFAERDKRKLQASHSLRVNLRPGESILYSRERKGMFFATRYLEEPREYANGLWRFRPRFSGEAWRAGVAAAENLVAVQDADGSWFLTAADPETPSQLTYEFSLPYPALDGEVQIGFSGEGLSLELSRDGFTWQKVETSHAVDGVQVFPLSGWLRSVGGEPDYRFWVRIAGSPSPVAWRLANLLYRYDLQMAPRHLALPSAATRTLAVDYLSRAPTQISVEVVLSQSSAIGKPAP